jgi:hypothetical protein
LFQGVTRLYYAADDKYGERRSAKAGATIVHTDLSAAYPWQVVQTSWSGESI